MRLTLPYAPETPDFVDTPEGRVAVPERMTPVEFMAFPFDEKDKWELIGGVPVLSAAPTPAHQRFILVLSEFLGEVVNAREGLELLPDADVLMPGQEDILRPDLALFAESDIRWNKGPVETVPLLVVEVLSPSTAGRDMGIKRESYTRGGVAEYWLADPVSGALSVFARAEGGEFTQQPADEDGHIPSPFVGKALRIQRAGRKYRLHAR
jgi:Uma2 family endonuclease